MKPARSPAAAVHRIQLALLEGAALSDRHLLAAGAVLSGPDYDDVVTERNIANLCGYPLCPYPLPSSSSRPRKGRFRIALREHRVYDLEETYKYCSPSCLVESKAFAASLSTERCADLSVSKVEKVIRLFENGAGEEEEELGKDGDLGFSKLMIQERDEIGRGEVSLEEWIGPSDAIEGYVPQFDRDKGLKPTEKGKSKRTSVDAGCSEADFKSTTFVGDEVNGVSSSIYTQDISDEIAKKLESVVLQQSKKKSAKPKSNSSKGNSIRKGRTDKKHEVDLARTSIVGNQAQEKTLASNHYNSEQLDFTSTILAGNLTSVISPNGAFLKTENHLVQPQKENAQRDNASMEKMKEPALKSSLKSTTSKNKSCSVKWADENITSTAFEGKDVKETSKNIEILQQEDVDSSLRFASAEACAAALIQAAENVSSGKSDAEDAVLEAGIVILPQPQDTDIGDAEENEDTFEFDRGAVKWPNKTILLDTDMFEVEDSWHDTPPEGFSLSLSSFATMYMTIFGWVTCASLAYIYGHDESSEDEFLLVNGTEYPRKKILPDGKSSEIRQALDGFVCRALPGLLLDLRLSTPVSILEKTLDRLLDTMSFFEALPSLRVKQWQVIVLLFLDALSVHRLPALALHMTNRNMLLHKVLNSAGITGEEYDSMRDLFIPLGRFPNFSTQCGK
ncbi:putative RNA polymerase II subunit B1 CTD phosphatase RPAP2 homolog [Typha angustifolia]|uniref:putative RNA polymerase II subunit B1 CTD phosphatase RPAP2 homolog n=1 Tax=Typha angustifolia TaxID=59011 RepID=UPI003C30B97D